MTDYDILQLLQLADHVLMVQRVVRQIARIVGLTLHQTPDVREHHIVLVLHVAVYLLHCAIENKLFMPAGIVLEEKMKDVKRSETDMPFTVVPDADVKDDGLSNREKEIIALVAKGMANKEIADTLCLSVHTVTTHRRNIASKLQIHSAAGLAIYAILHNIIDISEVSKL